MRYYKNTEVLSRAALAALLLNLSLLQQSCGGGGGGGGGSPAAAPAPAPVSVSFSPASYTQSVSARSATEAIVTVSARASNNVAVSYAITAGNEQGYFSIGADNGQIRLTSAGVMSAPGAEYRLTVTASVPGSAATATAAITLADTVSFVQSAYQAAPRFRNTTDAIVVLQAQTSGAGPIRYAITAGNDGGFFRVDSTGTVFFTATAGGAPSDTYTLTIEASLAGAGGAMPAQATVEIELTSSVLFEKSSYSVAAAVPGSSAPLVQVVADASRGSVSYAITAGDDQGYFEVGAGDGQVRFTDKGVGSIPAGDYQLTVTATSDDSSVEASEVLVDISVASQIVLTMSAYEVTPVHRDTAQTIATVDARLTSGGALVYSITSGNDSDYFTIDSSTGAVRFTAAGAAVTRVGMHALTISVDDAAGDATVAPVTATLTVVLGDLIRFGQDSYQAMPAHRSRFIPIVTVSATTSANAPISYTISSGNEMNFFRIGDGEEAGMIYFTLSAQNAATGDYELTIRASNADDSIPLLRPVTVTITLGEIITIVSDTTVTVRDRNFQTENPLTQVSAIVSPTGSALSYAIAAGNDNDWFAIDASGAISLRRLDFNPPASAVALEVRVSSSGGANRTASISISFDAGLTRVLAFEENSYSFDLSLANPTAAPQSPVDIGTPLRVLGTAVAVDPVAYRINNCPSPCAYAISVGGQLTLTGALDLNMPQALQIEATTTVPGVSAATTTVSVNISPALYFVDSMSRVIDAPQSVSVDADDADMGDTIDYAEAMILPADQSANYGAVSYRLVSATDAGGSDARAFFTLLPAGGLSWAQDGFNRLSYTLMIEATATATGASPSSLTRVLALTVSVPDTKAPVLTMPSLSAIFTQGEVEMGELIATLTVMDNIDSPEAVTIEFVADTGNPGLVSNPATKLAAINGRELRWNAVPGPGDIGSYTLTVVAVDTGANRGEPITVGVEVRAPNRAPLLSAGDITIGRAQTVSGLAGARDAEFVATSTGFYVYVITDSELLGYRLRRRMTSGGGATVNPELDTETPVARVALSGAQDLAATDSRARDGLATSSFLFVSVNGATTDSVYSYRINANGSLTSASQVDDSNTVELKGVSDLAVAIAGTATVLCAIAPEDKGMAMFSIASDGALTHASSLDDSADNNLGLDGVSSIAAQGGYAYVAGENRISVIDLTDSGNQPALSYSSHQAATTSTFPEGELHLTVVSVRPDSESPRVHALVAARNGSDKSADGVYLIPIVPGMDMVPALSASGQLSLRDGANDALAALGDPLSISASTLEGFDTEFTDPNINVLTLTTADQSGAVLQYLASYTGSAWTLSALSALTGAGTDSSYRIAGPASAQAWLYNPDDNLSSLILTLAVSPVDAALTMTQTLFVDLPDLISSSLLTFGCDDNDCATVTASLQAQEGSGDVEFALTNPVVSGVWQRRLGIPDAMASFSEARTDQYFLSFEVRDGTHTVGYFVAFGAFGQR